MTRLTISRAARASGVNVETIRYYERRELIAQPAKPAGGGSREYDNTVVAQIKFIRQAQKIGFSLREIKDLLSLRTDPDADCSDVRRRAAAKLDEVIGKIAELSRIRGALDDLIASCPGGGDVKACTILDAMERGTDRGEPNTIGNRNARNETKVPMKTTVLTIEGMHCEGCARTIEALLARSPGVRKVEASFKERRARILHDATEVPVADLIETIAKGGFVAKPAN